MSSNRKTEDEKVGYAKPPKNSQFKPGQSGNPKGRPKGSRGLKQVVRAALDDEVPVSIGGETVNKTKREMVVLRLIQKAVAGDVRAIDSILNLDQKFDIAEEAREAFLDPDKLDEEYRKILDAYVEDQAALEGACMRATKPSRKKSEAKKPAPGASKKGAGQ